MNSQMLCRITPNFGDNTPNAKRYALEVFLLNEDKNTKAGLLGLILFLRKVGTNKFTEQSVKFIFQ